MLKKETAKPEDTLGYGRRRLAKNPSAPWVLSARMLPEDNTRLAFIQDQTGIWSASEIVRMLIKDRYDSLTKKLQQTSQTPKKQRSSSD